MVLVVKGSADFLDSIGFEDIGFFQVVESIELHATFHAFAYFLDIVFLTS